MRPFPLLLAATLALAGCDGQQTAAPPAPMAPAEPTAPAGATAPAAPAPVRATLVREGVQTVTLDLVNGTDTPIVSVSAVVNGQAGPNLLPIGTAIPPGGSAALPVAVGAYLLQAQLQSASVFAPRRAILRHVVVPRFPPSPAPRMQVTLR